MKDTQMDKTYDKQYESALSMLYGWNNTKIDPKKASAKLKSLYEEQKYPQEVKLQLFLGIALYDNAVNVNNARAESEKWFYSVISASSPKDENRKLLTSALSSEAVKDESSPQIQFLYAYCLLSRSTLDRNAGKYFHKAAEKNYAPAQYMLALCYAYGACMYIKNPKKAFEWAQKAAFNGETQADLLVGTYYHEGFGVEKDDAKALEYLQKAVENEVEGTSEYLEQSGLIIKIKEEKANDVRYGKLLDEIEKLRKELEKKDSELQQKDELVNNSRQNVSEFEAAAERIFRKYSSQIDKYSSQIDSKLSSISEKQDNYSEIQKETLAEIKKTKKEVEESRKDMADLSDAVTVHFKELSGKIDNFESCIADMKTRVENIFDVNTKMYQEASGFRETFGTQVDELIKTQSDQSVVLKSILDMQRELEAKVEEQLTIAQKKIDEESKQFPQDIKDIHEAKLKASFGDSWRNSQRLSTEACERLISARVLLHYSIEAGLKDYRGVVISATSALEYELCRRFYDGYMSYLKKRLTNDKRIPIEKKYGRFTMGSLVYVLQKEDKTSEEIALMNEYLKKYVFSEKAEKIMRDKKYTYAGHVYIGADENDSSTFSKKVENIKYLYRNKAAHKDPIGKSLALDCCRDIGIGEAQFAVSSVEGVLFDLLDLTKKFNK